MPPLIRLGVNANFAKYVYGPHRTLEVVRSELDLYDVEMVADNDFGPALFLSEPEEFRKHHRSVAKTAGRLGVQIHNVFTVYRDGGAIGSNNPQIRESAYRVGLSIIEQAACYGAPYAGLSFFTLNAEDAGNPGRFAQARADAIEIWKRWMNDAARLGVPYLLVEMAAALREECSTIADTRRLLDELLEHHRAQPESSADVALCYDTGHGISPEESSNEADRDYRAWLEEFPDLTHEIHLKNTDPSFLATTHFTESDGTGSGIINPREVFEAVRDIVTADTVYFYLEIPGKRGRQSGEQEALRQHRESLVHLTNALRQVGYQQDSDSKAWSAS